MNVGELKAELNKHDDNLEVIADADGTELLNIARVISQHYPATGAVVVLELE